MLQNAYFLAKIGADTAENEQQFVRLCMPETHGPDDPLSGAGAATEGSKDEGGRRHTRRSATHSSRASSDTSHAHL